MQIMIRKIEPNAPVFYIPEIMGDPLLHEFHFGGFATEAFDLCPTGQPRFNVLPKGVVCN